MKKQVTRVSDFEFGPRSGTMAKAMVQFEDGEPFEAKFEMEYVYEGDDIPVIKLPAEVTQVMQTMFKIELDGEEVIEEYVEAIAQQKAKKEEEEKVQRGIDYDESPLHLLIEEAKKYEGVVIAKMGKTKEEYMAYVGYQGLSLELGYKGIDASVDIEYSRPGSSWKFAAGYSLFSPKRRWSKPSSVLSKFVEAAKDKLAAQSNQAKAEKEAKAKQGAVVAKLEELGYSINAENRSWHLKENEYAISCDRTEVAFKKNGRPGILKVWDDTVSLNVRVPVAKLGALLELINVE